MTYNDILRMAREAGIDAEKDTLCRYEGWVEPIERFAALIAAAEREACARIVDPTEHHRRNPSIYLGGNEGVELLEQTAEDIRARGQE